MQQDESENEKATRFAVEAGEKECPIVMGPLSVLHQNETQHQEKDGRNVPDTTELAHDNVVPDKGIQQ